MLVLDTQIVLEGRPLEELPWVELEKAGPILLLCTAKMLSEVDAKKRDGRLGPRARKFNRLIEPSIGSSGAPTIIEGTPRVDLALVANSSIDWSILGDLDREEGDDRIIAEALHAQVSDPTKLTVLSYDARPRAAAARHGLKSVKPPEEWILQPEPSPADKENLRLRQRVQELEASQPSLQVELSTSHESPLRLIKVKSISDDQADGIARWYLELNPPYEPGRYVVMRDYGYDRRYDEFEGRVQRFGRQLGTALEQLYNQFALELRVEVEGTVPANHVDVQVIARNGLLHDQLVVGPVVLPQPPEYEPGASLIRLDRTIADVLPQRVGRHEFVVDPPSTRSDTLRLACEDFRHGRVVERRVYLTPDVRSPSPVVIEVVATAGNLKGRVLRELSLSFEVEEVAYDELVDLSQGQLSRPYPLLTLARELAKSANKDELDMSAVK